MQIATETQILFKKLPSLVRRLETMEYRKAIPIQYNQAFTFWISTRNEMRLVFEFICLLFLLPMAIQLYPTRAVNVSKTRYQSCLVFNYSQTFLTRLVNTNYSLIKVLLQSV